MSLALAFLLMAWPQWLVYRYQAELKPEAQYLRVLLLMLAPLPIFAFTRLLPMPTLWQAILALLLCALLAVAACVWVYRFYAQQISIAPNKANFSLPAYFLLLIAVVLGLAFALRFFSLSSGDESMLWARHHATQLLTSATLKSQTKDWLNTASISIWPHYLAALEWPSLFAIKSHVLTAKLAYAGLWVASAFALVTLWRAQGISLLSIAVTVMLFMLLPQSLRLMLTAHAFSLVLLPLFIAVQSLLHPHGAKRLWLAAFGLLCLVSPLALGIAIPYALILVSTPKQRAIVAWIAPWLLLLLWQIADFWPGAHALHLWPVASEHVASLLMHLRSDLSLVFLVLLVALFALCRGQFAKQKTALFFAWLWSLWVLFLVFTPDAWWLFTQGADPKQAPRFALTLIFVGLLPVVITAVREAIHSAQGLVLTTAASVPQQAEAAPAIITPAQDPRPLLERALVLQQSGEIASAKALYLEVLAIDPDHPDAQHLLGLIALANGALAEAEDRIKKAIKVFPEHSLFHQSLADVASKQLRFKEAVESLNQALVLDPKNLVAKTKLLAAKRKLTQQEAVNKLNTAKPAYEIIVDKPKAQP